MSIYSLDGAEPEIAGSAYVAESASVIGRVKLAERTSIWSNAVLRADNEPISIGEGSNVQEGAVLHNDKGYPVIVGAGVSVGHQATLHGCTVGDGSLIGIHAVVLNGAVIGKDCLVGASALVTEAKTFPDRTLILGAPAKAVRELTEAEVLGLRSNAIDYIAKAAMYKAEARIVVNQANTLQDRYSAIIQAVQGRALLECVPVGTVNPAYTSVIGRVKYAKRLGIFVHLSAALSIGRRSMGYFGTVPGQGDIPEGKGEHLIAEFPVRKRSTHEWSQWARVSKAAPETLAEWHRLRKIAALEVSRTAQASKGTS